MKKNSLKVLAGVIAALLLTSVCFAAGTQTIPVTASIPQTSVMSVAISKVVGTTFTPGQTSMAFGTLVYDAVNKIYTAPHYFAVDVGIASNAASWTIAHTKTSIVNGANNLDGHVNVTFMRQHTTNTPVQLAKVSYAASTLSYTNAQILAGEWLRVYYGIGTGVGDATGVTPIPVTKAQGAYSGSVTFTLTP